MWVLVTRGVSLTHTLPHHMSINSIPNAQWNWNKLNSIPAHFALSRVILPIVTWSQWKSLMFHRVWFPHHSSLHPMWTIRKGCTITANTVQYRDHNNSSQLFIDCSDNMFLFQYHENRTVLLHLYNLYVETLHFQNCSPTHYIPSAKLTRRLSTT